MNLLSLRRAIWVLGGLALLLSFGRNTVVSRLSSAQPLVAVDRAADAPWFTGGFRTAGVYPTTGTGGLPPFLATAGSWLDTDEWQGRSETTWFGIRRGTLRVAVAGYPQDSGCKLWAEFRNGDGTIARVECDLADPHEAWEMWKFRGPRNASAMRLVAEDRSTERGGWLAFSQPFTGWAAAWLIVYLHAQAVAIAAFVLILIAAGITSRAGPAPGFPSNDSGRRRGVRGAILGLALLAVVVGPIRLERESAQPLAVVEGRTPMAHGPFAARGVHGGINLEDVPRGLATRGSWIETGDFKGSHETGWFRAQPQITLMVVGYPNVDGNRLELEVRRRDGTLRRIAFADDHPGESWQPWLVDLPSEAEAVRVCAVDDSTGPVGWLGFSEPFVASPKLGRQAWGLFQLLTATCLAITLLYGPGLLWFHARARSLHQLAFAVLPGPLVLAALGIVCWVAKEPMTPAIGARSGVLVLLGWILWHGWPARFCWRLPNEATAVIGAGALLAGFAVAKANVSHGPVGELFHHSVSRSLAVGGHSDSRISYHVTQLIGNRLPPFGPEAGQFFSPWSFGSRGPLAGLAAAPLVLATGGAPPRGLPDQVWQPFDREGFAGYRITLIVLASLAAWVVFAVIAAFASQAWATVAAITVQLTPFFVHEMYFTWPKLIAAALVLAAFLLGHKGRPFAAGVVLALGYLFHPLAIMSAPFVALWLLARPCEAAWWRRLRAPAICAAGALALVVPWQILGHAYRGEGATQTIFLHYFQIADSRPAPTWAVWWQSRWDNFANTFVPGYLFTGDPDHESINAFYRPSDTCVRWSFAYWNTLPFALGLPGFLLVAAAGASVCRRAPAIALVTVVGPALLLIVYWGAASTGLMRHCGHVLFLSVIVLAIWSLARWETAWRRTALATLLHPACFAWRAFEIALVAFGTTLLNRMPRLQSVFGWNDVLSLAIGAVCLGVAVILLANTAGSIRSALFVNTRAAQS